MIPKHLTLLVHGGQKIIQTCGRNNQPMAVKLRITAWNVRTRQFSISEKCNHWQGLARYVVDIAALSETRISGESEFTEVGAGCTFFC